MGIQEMVAYISKSINERKLVIFVGAGVSKNYGYPDWNKLTDKILKEIKQEKHSKLKENLEKCKQPVIEKNKNIIRKEIDKLGYATDECLVYAQYLYDYLIKKHKEKEGKKRYKEIIKKILEDKENKTIKYEIIQKIFQLSPQHIITTNYDTLLEDYDTGIYETIAEDRQLAKTTLNSYIIKMHGDFSHKYFVLKESDYHNYHDNFKLIDNFIKSVFATYTILFVGFSANDPNFKQIYAWVSRILQKNARKAFFLNIKKKSFDIHKTRYFENKYIYIINFDDLQAYHKDTKEIKDPGKRIEYCLDHLKPDDIDSFMEKINQIKYSRNPEVWGIEEFFKYSGVTIENDEITITNKQIFDFAKSSINKNSANKNTLLKILQKLTGNDGIIKTKNEDIPLADYLKPIPEPKTTKEIRLLTNFEFDKLESILKLYPIEPNLKNHMTLQRKAFLLNSIYEKSQSYQVLTELLAFYKKRNMFFEYFKTGLNRNYTFSFFNHNKEFFDFNKEINLIPVKDRSTYLPFLDYMQKDSYNNSLIKEASLYLDKIQDLEILFNSGGRQYNTLINRLKFSMNNTYKISYDEGICSNYSELFKLNLKSYFISYYTNYNSNKDDEKFCSFFGGLSKVTKLEFNYLYYAIQFLNPKDWNNILNYSDRNLEIKSKLTNKLLKLLHNICSYILQKETWTRKNTTYLVERLCNFIILFSKTSMEIKEFTQVIKVISPVIFKFDVYHYSKYLKILCKKHKKHFVSENNEKLNPLFHNMINSLEKETYLNSLSDFTSILSLFENVNFKKKLTINNKGINNIESLIENERAIFDKCIGINMLISIYHNCSKNMKIKLSSYVQNFFEDNFRKKIVSIHFYLCLQKAIKKNIFRKTEESNFIFEMLKQPLSEKDEHFVVYLNTVYQLKKVNKVNQKDINKYLSKYSKSNTFYRALLFEENFAIPITELKARWLLYLVDNQEMLLEFIKNYNLDYKELIMQVNTEIVLKENNKNKEKYRELLGFLLKHIDD